METEDEESERRLASSCFAASGLSKSKGEVRRKIDEGGVYVNNLRCADKDRRLTAADLASKTMLVLRLGRKNYALLRFV